jgi:hypothetical protein
MDAREQRRQRPEGEQLGPADADAAEGGAERQEQDPDRAGETLDALPRIIDQSPPLHEVVGVAQEDVHIVDGAREVVQDVEDGDGGDGGDAEGPGAAADARRVELQSVEPHGDGR